MNNMIFPCVVKDKDGNIKREYSAKYLTKKHWKQFDFHYRLNPRNNFIPPVSLTNFGENDTYI